MVDLRKKFDFGTFMRNNAVTVMFIALCIVCLYISGLTVPYVLYDSTCQKKSLAQYNEKEAAATGIFEPEGYRLMEKFLRK